MKIAIIGSGISGLTAAYLLDKDHDITLYEKNPELGGHAHTRTINIDGKEVHVDIGFIVFNHRNYPNLTGLFDEIEVDTAPSDMSFGVKINDGWLEYGTPEPHKLLAQKRNILRPKFLKMLFDILRFNKRAYDYIDTPDVSLGQCLDELNMGDWFKRYFILPMGGAIWSTPLRDMHGFPASTFIRFFHNHGLLTVNDQPQWFTVKNGSHNYVQKIAHRLNGEIRTSCGVTQVTRAKPHIRVKDESGRVEKYDHVIFATHSDQALSLIKTPLEPEAALLSKIRYQPNQVILHTDESFMPRRKAAWTSWSYMSDDKDDTSQHMSLTYWMNNLQPLNTDKDIFVTLNPHRRPRKDTILHETVFEHPVFDGPAIKAQKQLDKIQGADRIYYCGAWQKYGFHEDGCASAVRIAERLGSSARWT